MASFVTVLMTEDTAELAVTGASATLVDSLALASVVDELDLG
ncbi:hypothetical protein LGMK_00885 [Leuconostoc sp. C2]|nr:hypothetical protein LGMK_00885 [Leuconostoc sp. C2]